MLLPEQWRLLETATETGPERYGMAGGERLLLYRAAIQTGLRSNELRSLTRGRLYFDSDPPYITCKAGSEGRPAVHSTRTGGEPESPHRDEGPQGPGIQPAPRNEPGPDAAG